MYISVHMSRRHHSYTDSAELPNNNQTLLYSTLSIFKETCLPRIWAAHRKCSGITMSIICLPRARFILYFTLL